MTKPSLILVEKTLVPKNDFHTESLARLYREGTQKQIQKGDPQKLYQLANELAGLSFPLLLKAYPTEMLPDKPSPGMIIHTDTTSWIYRQGPGGVYRWMRIEAETEQEKAKREKDKREKRSKLTVKEKDKQKPSKPSEEKKKLRLVVNKEEWKPGKAQILTAGGLKQTVDAHNQKGLSVHQEKNGSWSVSHTASGKQLLGNVPSKAQAKTEASALHKITNWTRNDKEITSGKDSDKIRETLAKLNQKYNPQKGRA